MPGKPDFSITMGLEGVATIATGISSVIQMMGQVLVKVREVADAVDQYGDVLKGHSVSVSEAQGATNDLIDVITMHRQAARLEAAGIELTSNQYRALSVAALEYANRTGTDATEAMERLTSATISASARGLRPFGMALREGGTQAERQQRVLEQLTRTYGQQTYAVNGTADSIDSLANTWQRAWLEMATAMERNAGPISTILQTITRGVSNLANALEAQRRAQDHIARMGTVQRQLEIERELQGLGYAHGRIQTGPGAAILQGVGYIRHGGTTGLRHHVETLVQELDTLQQIDINRIASGQDQPVAPEERTQIVPDLPDPSGGGGQSQAERLREQIAQKERSVFEALRDSEQRVAELYADQSRGLHELWADLDQQRTEAQAAAAQQRVEAEVKAQEHLEEVRRQYEEQAIERQQREAEERQENLDAIADYASTAESIYSQMISAAGGLAVQMASSEEEKKKIQGEVMIAEQVGALLLATTMAALEFARNNYAQGALYTAAAVTAGIGIAQTETEFGVSSKSGATGGSSSAASSRGSAGSARGTSGGSSSRTVYVQIYGPVTSRRVYEEVTALERDSARAY
jgi:hypothetical protein